MAPALLHVGEVWSFVFEEERAVSRKGLVFGDITVSDSQGTWRTEDVVTDEAWEEVW